ncbi:formimidoylglutamase [Kordia algicida OT-1]|uniref:Formiminoglutamate hydrolase n=1 Tax=Kordia algicida OT-1 TaxID=391587 RepID=A9E7P9_9FLAO|nr:formimidoylglutamase [Kordia algicida]EDP94920.1 Formiminoglutamate hydrolase [Kordia algicida OT-1]
MLHLYTRESLNALISKREGETKFGEKVETLSSQENLVEQLQQSEAKYVLFGIPEDIGVRANRGKAGATTAWKAGLKSLLNTQDNAFNKGRRVLVLGHLDFSELMKRADSFDEKSPEYHILLSQLVTKIDEEVTYLMFQIVSTGKIPIVIGGGHNNAYGNCKGTALGKSKAINVINFDAHTDFRSLEGRHSGNGFSYAFKKYFIDKYFMFGLHENYTSKKVFKTIDSCPERIQYNTFEGIHIRQEQGFSFQLNTALNFINNRPFGVEVDCDSIENVPSSAMTPSGFTANQARTFVSFFGNQKNAAYLHLCEAAPNPDDPREMYLIGKLLSYLITDFIRK